MLIVENMLSTILVAVPAPSRVEPVTISGPTATSIACSAAADSGVPVLQDSPTVSAPRAAALRTAPSTWGTAAGGDADDGVERADAQGGQVRGPGLLAVLGGLDELTIAPGPPAIRPMTTSPEVPNVGGISEASRMPRRPEVPAPT